MRSVHTCVLFLHYVADLCITLLSAPPIGSDQDGPAASGDGVALPGDGAAGAGAGESGVQACVKGVSGPVLLDLGFNRCQRAATKMLHWSPHIELQKHSQGVIIQVDFKKSERRSFIF